MNLLISATVWATAIVSIALWASFVIADRASERKAMAEFDREWRTK